MVIIYDNGWKIAGNAFIGGGFRGQSTCTIGESVTPQAGDTVLKACSSRQWMEHIPAGLVGVWDADGDHPTAKIVTPQNAQDMMERNRYMRSTR